MRNLIAFLIRNGAWFFFIFLEIICFYFVFQYNSYQHSLYLNSSNEIVGRVYSVSGGIRSYFNLREANNQLSAQNAEMQGRIWALEDYVKNLSSDTITTRAFAVDSVKAENYEFIVAGVVNNSVNRVDNYITINKGAKDGVRKEMGVISQQGIVGIVRELSDNFSVIQPVLNSRSFQNCKIKGSNNPGTLVWDGKDYRYANLQDFPRHEKFVVGDTIITSGFSSIFPEGILVGVVEDFKAQSDDNFLTLKIRLFTDFASLSNVVIIDNKKGEEQAELEKALEKQNKNAE